MLLILQDAIAKPKVFHWNNPIPDDRLDRCLRDRKLVVPEDLKRFWMTTGGGSVFESEDLLGPFGNAQLLADFDGPNDCHRSKGLPADWLLFHTGTWLSAIRSGEPQYLLLNNHYAIIGEYVNFEQWYRNSIRAEFADRYGLQSASPV